MQCVRLRDDRSNVSSLTSAQSCVYLRSGAPASQSVSGKNGIWSCNLQDASRGRNHRSQLEGGIRPKQRKAKC